MPLKYRLPLVFFFTFFVLFFSVHAHGPSPAHVRRSLAFKKKLHRQLDIPGAVGDLVGDLLGNTGTTSTSDSSSTSTTSSDATSLPTTDPTNTDPPSTSSSTTTTPPSSDTPSTTPPSTSPPPSSDTPTSTPSTTSSGTSSSPLSSSTPSPDSSSCLLGLDLLGNCILPTSSSNTDSSLTTTSTTPSSASSQTTDSPSSPPTDPPTSQTTSTPSSPPTSSPDTPTPTTTPTPDCPLGLVINGECVLPSSSSSTPPSSASSPSPTSEPPPSTSPPPITPDPGSSSSSPTSDSEPPTTTPSSSPPVDPCGPVGQLLGHCSSNSSPPASTPSLTSTPQTNPSTNPPDSSSQSAPSQTSTPSQPVDPCGSLGISLGLCTSLPSSATTPQAPPQSTDPCGPLGISLGLCPSSSPPGSSSSGSFSPPALPTGSSVFTSSTITPPGSCGSLGLCGSTTTPDSGTTVPSSPPGTQSQPSSSGQSGSTLSTSFPSGIPTSWSGTVSTTSGSGNGTSLSSPPVIAFPSGTNDTVSSTTSFSSTPTSDTSFPSFTPPPQTQLSYVTQASLLGASVPSSSPVTLSDPDAVPSTLTIVSPSSLPSTTTPVLLPSNLPARIYPPTQVDSNSLSGFSLVSILFDQFLSWPFVAQNTQSQGQLFLWLPTIIQSALGLPSEKVKTFALQVFLPAAYSGPGDVDMLLTTFLLYIPSDQVAVLGNQIKVISSPFYTSLQDPYKTLASHVNPAYSLTSVQDPNAVPGTGTTSSASSSGNKSRTDAIIGVASALGGLALVVLGVLIYRSVKRSRDLSHRRLSDPNAPNDPYPDRTGRDFDQDSVGGQRRRSFYFAEDSLRGQQAVQQTAVPVAQPQHVMQQVSQVEYSYRTSPDGVRERRAPVATGAISAPILTQSSLNW
ncbi:hypothetical protein H4582DRAFT_2195164 [Lactarius indigo]|nr:hypothetical protein H4582DRAFT_2195164 [Lactarius indigo]